MESKLTFRPYLAGDEISVLKLFRQSFGRDLGERVWEWRFRDNPAGAGVIDLSWDGDVLAAHYAVTPAAFRIHGRDWLTGLSGTTMTHPDYRGRGLFPKLARRTYGRMAEMGMAMVWGFPNALSHRGFVEHLNWTDIYEIPTFRLALPAPRPLPTPGDEVVELAEFDGRFDSLWDRVKDEHRIICRRDQQQLNWRYFQNPSEHYRILAHTAGEEIAGYCVFKRYRQEWQVVDILIPEDNVRKGVELIARVVELAAVDGASAVSLWLNVTRPLHRALEKLGFRNGEPITYFGALALQPGLVDRGLCDFRHWYLTMGDSDVF